MRGRPLILRAVALLAWGVWVGGFTFYSAAVIPILHDAMDRPDAGQITRRVTDALNVAGAGALAAWWVLGRSERRLGPAWARRARSACLAASSALWLGLVVLHRVMDRHLDARGTQGFYPLHRAYLLTSTFQWLANVALLVSALAAWGDDGPESQEARDRVPDIPPGGKA